MKKSIYSIIVLLVSNNLMALDFNSAKDLVVRGEAVYEKFQKTPFTGIGKITIKESKKCNIYIASFKNGQFNGASEEWSCDGNLISKGVRIGDKSIGHQETWNKKTGKKESDLIYDNNGNIKSGWKKWRSTSYSSVYLKVDVCYLENFTYTNGKKTGYAIYDDKKCHKNDKVAYYKDDKFIGCKTCKR